MSEQEIEALAEALADQMEARITEKFYHDFGKGLWGLFWKSVVALVMAVAAWGAYQNGGFKP